MVLDVKTGEKLANFNNIRPEHFIVNNLTDRLYLVSNDGDVQCIKTETADLPTLVAHTEPKKKTTTKPTDTAPKSQQCNRATVGMTRLAATRSPLANPSFGAGGGGGNADPFGGGGGNTDPFGGGGAGNADPFGGDIWRDGRPVWRKPILIQVSEQIEGTTEMLPLGTISTFGFPFRMSEQTGLDGAACPVPFHLPSTHLFPISTWLLTLTTQVEKRRVFVFLRQAHRNKK